MVVKSLKYSFILFSWTSWCDQLLSWCNSVFTCTVCIVVLHLAPACYYLTLVCYLLTLVMWHLTGYLLSLLFLLYVQWLWSYTPEYLYLRKPLHHHITHLYLNPEEWRVELNATRSKVSHHTRGWGHLLVFVGATSGYPHRILIAPVTRNA